MTLGNLSIRWAILLGAFAISGSLSAAPNPSTTLLVVTRSERALVIADPNSMKVLGSVPIGGGGLPHEVAVSADGNLAFVTNSSLVDNPKGAPDDFISVIDLTARKELQRIETGKDSNPHGIMFADGKVYFTCEGYKLIGRYDPVSKRIDWMQGTGQSRTHEFVITKDAKTIVTSNRGSRTVSVIESAPFPMASVGSFDIYQPKNNWNISEIPIIWGPDGIGMSPDEKEVWVGSTSSDTGDGRMSIINVAAKKVSQSFEIKAKDPVRLAFTPDGKRVLSTGGKSQNLLVFDAVTRQEIKRIDLGAMMHGIVVAPDGLHAYVCVFGGKQVAVIDLKKLEVSGHIEIGSVPEGIIWAETK